MLLELLADLSDDAVTPCQIHQSFGISTCRCSTLQSSPPMPLGLPVNSCQRPHTPLHQHTAWYLATEEALGKAGNVPEFSSTGEMTLAHFANACQFTTSRHGDCFCTPSPSGRGLG